MDTKSISVGVFVPTGSAFENENERGLAHFVEHMLFKGTKSRSYKDIAEEMDRLGGTINAFTSKEYTCFYVKVLKDYADQGIDILQDIISSSLIDEKELNKEKGVIIEEINMTQDNPDEAAFEHFMENAMPCNFGKPILGTRERINSYTRNDLVRFMGKYYQPENLIVSIVGKDKNVDFSFKNRFAFEDFFTDEKNTNIDFKFKSGTDVVKREIQQSNIVIGFELFDIYDERKYAAYLLSDIFGGTMSSRLFQTIREEQSLCYHISSSVKFFRTGGLGAIFAGTYKDNTQKLLDSVKKEFEKLKKGYITKEELSKAKTHFKGTYLLSLESPYAVMAKQGIDNIFYGKYIDENYIIEKIDSVTTDNIADLINLIDIDKFHITVLGDIDKIEW